MIAATRDSFMVPLYRQLIASTLCAVLALLLYFVMPERRERLLPDRVGSAHLFFDAEHGGRNTATWLDQGQLRFKCMAGADDTSAKPYCGVSINLAHAVQEIDYAIFERMEIKIGYQGGNRLLRLRMTNFTPARPGVSDRETLRSMDVSVLAEELQRPLVIHNQGWIATESAGANNNVVTIVVDMVPPMALGEHVLYIESMDVYGQRLPIANWTLGVALAWLLSIALIIGRHLTLTQRRIAGDAKRLSALADVSDELQQKSQRYQQLSNIDPLTGALNRNGFSTELAQRLVNELLRPNTTVMVIDIDHFKRINDVYGHLVGDAVLRETAALIHDNTRATDLLVRWGGEEFIFYCERVEEAQAVLLADKIRLSVEAARIGPPELAIQLTVSIGVAVAEPREALKALIDRADKALYLAKNQGRNRVAVAETDAPS
jgi:diguanylate cyclase (GGDEF)-like protein